MGSFWNRFGIVSGYSGVVLGSLWYRFGGFGGVLGSFWGRFGLVSGSSWDRFGIVLGSFWGNPVIQQIIISAVNPVTAIAKIVQKIIIPAL